MLAGPNEEARSAAADWLHLKLLTDLEQPGRAGRGRAFGPSVSRITVMRRMAAPYSVTLWRQMAEEARAVAARMKNADSRRELLQIARGYEALAKLAEAMADQNSGTDQAPPE